MQFYFKTLRNKIVRRCAKLNTPIVNMVEIEGSDVGDGCCEGVSGKE